MALCTRDEVLERLGGPEVAAQLLDPNRTGEYDTAMLDGAISDAEGDVSAAYGARYVGITSNPPPKIRRLTAELAVVYLWRRGARNLAVPPVVQDMERQNRRELERIESSETSPGGNPVSRNPLVVDNSDGGRRSVYPVWRRAGINGGR